MATLKELKEKAAELGLSTDEVRKHGKLTLKSTWEAAIAMAGIREPNKVRIFYKPNLSNIGARSKQALVAKLV